MSAPGACDACVRRAALIASLSGAIDGAMERRPASRVRELLSLEDSDLRGALRSECGDACEELDEAGELDALGVRDLVGESGCWSCCRHAGPYPPRLGDLRDAPAALFARGSIALLRGLPGAPAVTIVGSRQASAYGREVAAALARDLAAAGVIVISGLAIGIDSCAHEGALAGAGATIAVLGGGPERASPAQTRRLYERIAREGLVLSELTPGTAPRRWSFPARNRIMAALSEMTIVVEGRSRSGSLITADFAQQLGREVGAVPGQVGAQMAAGPNHLLRDGAHVIRGAEDVIDALIGAGARLDPLASARRRTEEDDPELTPVLEAVDRGAADPEAVSVECGLAPDAAVAALVRLELRGLVVSDGSGRYRRPARAGRGPE